jgi:excisionase family DNA binding protein
MASIDDGEFTIVYMNNQHTQESSSPVTPGGWRDPIPTPSDRTQRLLYTPEQAADALQCSRSKVYDLMNSGRLRSVHLDKLRRIPGDALDEFVADLEGAR